MERRNAILTGASYGIGSYIARALAARDTNLLLVARSESELTQLAHELRGRDSRVAAATIDLADTEEIETVIRVDLIAPIELSRLLLPGMLDRGYGRIINISSIAGRVGFPHTEAYAASKDGLIAFSRVLRNDYRRAGVSASAIVLGAVKNAGIGQRTLDEFGATTNTSFMVTPEKVASAVVRAIDKDKAEIVVTPGPGRLMKALMDLFPSLGPAMNRLAGAEKLMSSIADYREAQHRAPPDRPAPSLGAATLEATIATVRAGDTKRP